MTTGNDEAAKLDEVLGVLSSLAGVRHAFYLDARIREELMKTEKQTSGFGPLVVHNEGVLECLSRKHVACIVKDKHFRPPPTQTVVLVDENGTVIGKEILPGEKVEERPGVKNLYIGKDFVIFYDGKSGRNARFVLPPVPFVEVERINGTSRVCSSSPSTLGDFLIKRNKGLPDDPKLATVLVGFDLL